MTRFQRKVRVFIGKRFGSSQTFSYLPAYEDGTECSETSAYKIQTPGNYPEERIQHSKHLESLKSRIFCEVRIFSLLAACLFLQPITRTCLRCWVNNNLETFWWNSYITHWPTENWSLPANVHRCTHSCLCRVTSATIGALFSIFFFVKSNI